MKEEGICTIATYEFGTRHKLTHVPTELHRNEDDVDDDDGTTGGEENGCDDTSITRRNKDRSKEDAEVNNEVDQPRYSTVHA